MTSFHRIRIGALVRSFAVTAVVVLALMFFAGWRLLRHRRKYPPAA
jgi:hypothetical protein